MEPGIDTPETILRGVRSGLYLTDMLGFGENLTTGDFSQGAAGVWIENGELVQPVAVINIAGRLPEMLASIDAIGSDPTFVEATSALTFRMAAMMVSGR
jgi:PmbA protein